MHELPKFIQSPDPSIYFSSNWICGDLETTNISKGDASTVANRLVYGYFWGPKVGHIHVHSELDLLHLEDILYGTDFFLAHGSKFEHKWLRRSGIKIHRLLTYDTLLGDYVRAGNRDWPLDLDSCSKRYDGPGKDRLVNSLIHGGVCPSEIPTSWLRSYCRQDVEQTIHVFLRQREILKEEGLLAAQYLRCITTPVLADIEMNGIFLDKGLVDEIHRNYVTEHRELVRQLDKITGGINMASPAQVAKFLYEDMGFDELRDRKGRPIRNKPSKQFPEGQPCTDSDTIELLKAKTKEQKEFVKLKQEESKLRKKITGYTERFMYACGIPFTPMNDKNSPEKKFSKIIPGSCTVHGNLNQSIADTHRLTSSDPNLQNIDRILKKVVTSRNKDWLIRSDDFKQLEFRGAALLTQDPVIIQDVLDGRDVHQFTADTLTSAGQKTNRQEAKASCFPLDTEILTTEGWKKHNEVIIGDEVVSYNAEQHVLEKDIIIDYAAPHEQEVVEMRNKHNWSVRATKEHRWYGQKLTDQGNKGHTWVNRIFTTEELGRYHRINTSAVYMSSGALTPDEASFIAWCFSDGSVSISTLTKNTSQGSEGERQQYLVTLIQKKGKAQEQIIDNLLIRLSVVSNKTITKNNICRWSLSSPSVRHIFRKAGIYANDIDHKNIVLSLSTEARAAYLEAICLAEGTKRKHGEWRIAQNSGNFCEAIKLAAFLCGYDIRVTKVKMKYNGNMHEQITLRTRPYVNGTRITKKSLGDQKVWCVQTNNKTVVIKQGDVITISGNTFKPLFLGTSGTKAEQTYYEEFKKRYHITFEEQQKWIKEVLLTKKFKTVTGVCFYFPDTKVNQSGYITNTSKIGNNPIQMIATADLAPTAVTLLWHYMKAAELESFIVNEVHDSVVTELYPPEEELVQQYWEKATKEDLPNLFLTLFNFKLCLPLETDKKTMTHWDWSKGA